jgi:tellurite resistance protein TerC
MMGSLRAWLRRTITYKWARRIMVAVIGGSVLLIGIAMVVLPGPAIIVVPLGLGILGLEFAWARIWLRKLRAAATQVVNRVRGRRKADPPPRA